MPPETAQAVSEVENFESQVDGGGAQPPADDGKVTVKSDAPPAEQSSGDVDDDFSDDDWSNLAGNDDDEPAAAQPASGTAEVQPATAEPTSAAPAEPAPTTPAEGAPAQPTPAEPAQPAEPAVAQPDWATQFSSRVNELTDYYKLSEEDSEKLVADPSAVLPALAARVQAATEYAVMAAVQQQLPQILHTIEVQKQQNNSSRAKFYEPFPDLLKHVTENPEAEQVVINMRKTYLSQLPQGYSVEKANREVAIAAMTAFGLNPATAQPPTAAPTQPVTTRTPPRGGQPNSPAAPVSSAPGRPEPVNEFADLDEQFSDTGSAALY